MYKKQIVAVFFSIILLSGVTGAFSPNLANAASEKTLGVGVIFVTAFGKCSDRNNESLENYAYATSQILTKYNIKHSYPSMLCTNSDQLSYWIQEIDKTGQLDLVVIIPDIINSIRWLEAKFRAGHYFNNGYQNYIVSEALSLKVESKSSTWVLSHELAHFALFWKGYPSDVWKTGVHTIQSAYERCTSEDATGAFCLKLWTTVKTKSGKYFPVMAPLYTEDYKPESTKSTTQPTTPTAPTIQKTEVYINSYTALLENGKSATITGHLYAINGQNRNTLVNGVINLHDNSYDVRYATDGAIIASTMTDSSGYFELNWVVTKSGPKITSDNRWPLFVSFSGTDRWQSSYFKVNPNHYPKIDSDGDGILDNVDSCKYSAETFNGFQDSDGCPDTKPITKMNTVIEWFTPIRYPDGGWYYYPEGDNVMFSGKLTSVPHNIPIAGAEIRFVDYDFDKDNPVNKKIGNTITDKDGIFAYNWKGIHSEIGYSEPHGGSFWLPVAYFDGNEKFYAITKIGEQFIVENIEPSQKTFIAEASETGVLAPQEKEELVKTTPSIQNSEVWVYSYTALLENGKPATITGLLYGFEAQTRVMIPNAQIYLHDNSYNVKQVTEGPIIAYTTTNSTGGFEVTWTVTQSGPEITDEKRWPIAVSYSGSEAWHPSYDLVRPNYFQKIVSDESTTTTNPDQIFNKAIELKPFYKNIIDSLEKRFNNIDQLLSSLKFESQEAKQRFKDVLGVKSTALFKLKMAKSVWNDGVSEMEKGQYKNAVTLFEDIKTHADGMEGDLNWISTAISEAQKLEEQKTCIWFICW